MANLVSISNPLMQPVQFNGRTYYTGQYFHQMYRASSDADGKYKQTGTFLRLIRSIETYSAYVDAGDIVELTWEQVKGSDTDAEIASVIKSNGYNPIMLIGATAQAALTHHLDDEVSKQVSVAINRQAAQAADPVALKYRQAKTVAACSMSIFKLLGADPPMARALTVDHVREEVGIDFSKALAHNIVDEAPMNPTDLGHMFGMTGRCGAKMNDTLFRQGFAHKNDHGDWVPTEKGKPYCTCNPYKSPHSAHTGYRTLWYRRVLDVLSKEEVA